MAKYFSWVIRGRRKRWCENFKWIGHSFTEIVQFKIEKQKKNIKKAFVYINLQTNFIPKQKLKIKYLNLM